MSFGSTNETLNATSVARILGMMARTHNSSSSANQQQNFDQQTNFEHKESWNPDIFVQVVIDLQPQLSFKDVIKELDHPEFLIRDKMSLKLLISALKKGLKDQPFPIEYIYRIWKNLEGQLSWIIHSLKHPDVFTLAEYPSRRTATECLKAQPEDDNKLIAPWRSLNLIEILLNLSEMGVYSNCVELFKFPITHCPDLLLLGLLQLTNIWNKLKQEIISVLIPIFLNNHPNSAVILQQAWNQTYQTIIIRQIIMSSMADWYMKAQDAEQSLRLARILDVSQDLKALSILLNGTPLIFNIDLACLAARRGYLKLDKWMSDRIRDHGELFIQTVVTFLKRKVPQLNPNFKDDPSLQNSRPIIQMPLLPETVQTILKCIGASSNSVSTELSQEIFQMNVQARLILDKPGSANSQQQQPASSTAATASSTNTQTPIVPPSNQKQNLPQQPQPNQATTTYEMIQSMMNNLNMNALNNQQSGANFNNSPNILMQQISATAGSANQNLLLNNNNLDPNKMNVINSLLNNRGLNYNPAAAMAALRSSLNSPQLPVQPGGLDQSDQLYSKEIEEEVDKCIQNLFKTSNVEEFAAILSKCKDSQEKKDKDFYTYALKYIIEGNSCLYGLDEMQFHTMSSVWGILIERNILSTQMLSICLKLLLQMLSKSVNSKYYLFGIKVLDRCKIRLKDFASFCQCLMQLSNFQELPKVLKEYLEYGARGMLPPQAQLLAAAVAAANNNNSTLTQSNQFMANKFTTNPTTVASLLSANQSRNNLNSKPSIANTTNIETLLVANENDSNAKPPAPSEIIQDKIGFIFNNLSLSNMQVKSDELKDALKDEFWDWIAHYLVVKRVSIEPNFHTLYSHFVDTMKKESLNESILTETYRNIKVLLRSDKNDQKFGDRALLKNLGSWLGLITLAKSKPILHRDIDLKSLIIEAFQKGQAELLFVVPFVAKVLEPAGKSKIFAPPNPWVMSMLSVLVELHNEPDLKLNHKFEIEVLCKNLSLNINDIPVKNTLRNFEVCEEQLTKQKDPNAPASTSAASASIQPIQSAPNLTALAKLEATPAPQSAQTPSDSSNDLTALAAQQAAMVAAVAAAQQQQQLQQQQQQQVVTQSAKYKITDIKLQSLQNNSNLIYINPDIPLLNVQPALKTVIIPALDKAVSEMMHLLLDKAVKISVSTAEPLIKKDFALDPEENHMRIAARNMVANMSSGMMLITGKEPLTSHLFNALKTQFTQPLTPELANAYKDLINQACGTIVQDNIELCMCFLQKIAIQRSIIELERKLQLEFETRLRSRTEGRLHYDPNMLNYHQEKMPDMIRLKVGSISPEQFSVYEEFGKNLPGFKINVEERAPTAAPAGATGSLGNAQNQAAVAALLNAAQQNSKPPVFQAIDEMNIHYENAIAVLRNEVALMPNGHFLTINIQNLMLAIHEFKVTQQPQSAISLIKKLVTNLLEGYTLIQQDHQSSANQSMIMNPSDPLLLKYKDSNLAVLKLILSDQRFCNGNWIVKEVQKIWLECNQDYKYSPEGIAILFRYKLLNAQAVDLHISQFVETGNPKSIQFALSLLRYFYIENSSTFLDIQFSNLLESVSRISSVSRFAQSNPDLKDTIEVIRMNYENDEMYNSNRICATALSMMYTGVQQAKDFDDPHGLKEKSDSLLHDWIQHHSLLSQKDNTKAFQQFVLQMNSQGLFKTDEMITRFFRICTELCVESCYSYLAKNQRQACYQRLDAFVKLIILLVKHSGDQTNHVNKINLFNKVLGLIAGCLLYDQETKLNQFEPMPFHRLFFMLLFEATLPENNLEPIIYQIMQAFVNVYHIIRPSKAPGFAYSWLELVSHRTFISKMLQAAPSTQQSQQQNANQVEQPYKYWNMYATLLTQLIRFMAPFLRNIELTQSVMTLYKGSLRLFLVLLHDFPEFLCNCHYQFCDVIPPNCIQLRNLVLSAFPRCMKLPDPLTPNLKVDMIADIDSSPPKIAYPYIYNIPYKLKNDLDSYIKTRSPVTFLSDLRSYLQSSPETGSHYNIQLMNALVIYVGTNGIQALRSKGLTPTHANLSHSCHIAFNDIFQSLVVDLDSEGRYLFINAVANQLRYPNSHTHYFGCALLNLFAEANTEAIQEQITRLFNF